MNDLEHRLMRALAESRQRADEGFVSQVTQRIDAYESARTVHLYILTLIALCLAGALGLGLYLSWNAARVVSMTLAMTLSTTASVSSLALVAIALLVLRPRTHSRD
jgi:ABC-type proline/glycine betaine transport system permease subunit